MKSADLVAQMAAILPQLTDKFTTNFSVTSLTRTGTTVTAITSIDHNLVVGRQVNIVGAQTPATIDTLTRSGPVGTLITLVPHDMTEGTHKTVKLSGSNEAEFNGIFQLLEVKNRKTVTFTMVDAGPVAATGAPLLLNGSSYLKSYNGLHAITATPAANQFQYEVADATLFTPAAGTISARTEPRISAAISEDRLMDSYTKQPKDDLWAFVVLEDVTASKNRDILSDATDNIQRGDHYRQQVLQPFTVYVFTPTTQQIAGRLARDDAEDMFKFLCQALLFKAFDSGLSCGAQGPVQFLNHGFVAYNTAFYVHGYGYEQVVDITFDDTTGYDTDVAFRDVSLIMGVNTGAEVMTANIDLDDEVIP